MDFVKTFFLGSYNDPKWVPNQNPSAVPNQNPRIKIFFKNLPQIF